MTFSIIKASNVHYRYIAKLHIDGITEGFLSTLGTAFLSKLYEGVCYGPDSGIYVAVGADNAILGFVSYTKDVHKCYRYVLKNKFIQLSFLLLPNLLRVNIYKKIFETLAYPSQHEKNTEGSTEAYHPELLSIAVSKNALGKGVGKLLVKKLDDTFLLMGINKYYVVTHGIDKRSNSFYESCGFTLSREFENHGKPMNEYIKYLSTKDTKIH